MERAIVAPLWHGDLVERETLMPVEPDRLLRLLFRADSIRSVTSADGKTVYRENEDYRCTDGALELLPGTSIPVMKESEYYHYVSPVPTHLETMYHGESVSTYWGDGLTMSARQIAVTYTHSDRWEGELPPVCRSAFSRLLSKLEKGEDVTFFFYGDSITRGASATALTGVEPFLPIWAHLFTVYAAEKYGYTVRYIASGLERTDPKAGEERYGNRGTLTYINTAVGGWRSQNGIDSFDTHVRPFLSEHGCDLLVLGFGMNDGKNTTEEERTNLSALIGLFRELSPACEVAMIATMLPNPEATNGWFRNQHLFEAMQKELAASVGACAVVPMTSVSRYILTRKRFRDYSGNNINHPNDFMVRVYLHTLIRTVFGDGGEE